MILENGTISHNCKKHGVLTDVSSVYIDKVSGATVCKTCNDERSRNRYEELKKEPGKITLKSYAHGRYDRRKEYTLYGIRTCRKHGELKRENLFIYEKIKFCNICFSESSEKTCAEHGALKKEEIRIGKDGIKRCTYCRRQTSRKI